MKYKVFILLTIASVILFTADIQAYFFLSLIIFCLFAGLDILSPFFKIFRSPWGKRSLTLLQHWQRFRYPALIFLILGLGTKYHQLPLDSGYFSVNNFLIRQILYILLFTFFPRILSRLSQVSALFTLFVGGLFFYSFFFIDWGLLFFSPWHSTIFPLLMCSICVSGATGALLCQKKEIYEMGRLAITVLIFTLYLHFGQFLIIWQARIPEEMEWYNIRTLGIMGVLCLAMLVIKYLFALVLLFTRERIKLRRPLAISGILILLGFTIELAWIYRII